MEPTQQVDRSSPIPVWYQVAQRLSHDIGTGKLLPGSQLPSEGNVAARYGVHRHTARRALASLAEQGVIRIRRGLGTFVERPVVTYPISERTRFTATLQRQNRSPGQVLIEAFDEVPPVEVANALSLDAGSRVTVLRTLGLADDVPVSLATSYLPVEKFPDAASLYRELLSLTAVFERCGLRDYRRATTRITAGLPTDEEAAQLRQARRAPVLVVESVDVDLAGQPISFSRVRFAGDRVQLVVGQP